MKKEKYIPKQVGHYIRILMDDRGFNKSMLARKLEISPSTVTRIINGDIPMSYEIAFKLEKLDKRKSCYTWMNYQIKYSIYVLRTAQRKTGSKHS